MDTSPLRTLLEPDTLLQDRYLIVRLVGHGGMGAVYEAMDQRFQCRRALKETMFTDTRLLAAFKREAMLLNELRHPGLPRVLDYFTENNGQFLVMDYIDGENLGVWLSRRQRAFPWREVLKWADQLLDALEYLHRQQPPVIHRDIKPQNLKLSSDNNIILLDFGLAKGSLLANEGATSASVVAFTPNYAPIEQVQGLGTDARSDIYSLGATLYHLLTATKPADTVTRAARIACGQPDPILRADVLNTEVPCALADILEQALSLSQDRRPSSASVMRRLLYDFGIESPVEPGSELAAKVTITDLADALPEPLESYNTKFDLGVPKPAAVPLGPIETNPNLALPQGIVESQNALSAQKKKSHRLRLALLMSALLIVFAGATIGGWVVWTNNSTPNRIKRAEQFFREEKLKQAESEFRSVIAAEPNNGRWHLKLALVLLRQDERADAETELTNAVRLCRLALVTDPKNGDQLASLGMSLTLKHKWSEAENSLLAALRSDPNNGEVHAAVANYLYRNKNQLDMAERELRRAVSLTPSVPQWHYDLGAIMSAQNEDKEAEAVAEYREGLKLDPNNAYQHSLLAIRLETNGQFADAREEYAKSVRLAQDNASDANSQAYLSGILRNADMRTEAEAAARKAVQLEPNNPEFHELLSTFLVGTERRDELKQSQRLGPQRTEPYLGLAKTKGVGRKILRENLAETERIYRDELRSDPNNPWRQVNLGATLKSLDRSDEALAAYQTALQLDPDNAELHVLLGDALEQSSSRSGSNQLWSQADAEFKEAIRLEPTNLSWQLAYFRALRYRNTDAAEKFVREMIRTDVTYKRLLVDILVEKRRYAEAESLVHEQIRRRPIQSENYGTLGGILEKLNRNSEADTAYSEQGRLLRERTLQYPNNPFSRRDLADYLMQRKDWSGAEKEFRVALKLEPSFGTDWWTDKLATTLIKQNRQSEAEQLYKDKLQTDPTNADIWNSLISLLVNENRMADADAAFRDMIRAEPDNAANHNSFGKHLAAQNRHAEAELELRQATELEPTNASYFYELGANRTWLGRNEETRAALKRAVELDPNNEQYQAALRKVS